MQHTGVPVAGGMLAARAEGSGDPVLVVQTALSVDELVPLMQQAPLRHGHRILTFDRRGYGSSVTAAGSPATIATDVLDCLAVVEALQAVPTHVVGCSYSAAVALSLAAAAPGAVRSLTLVEPPPRHIPAAQEFISANRDLEHIYRRDGVAAALETFMVMLAGPLWRQRQEQFAPGSVARLERDAAAFFGRDLPALTSWEYGPGDAEKVTGPVLYVGGADSGPWFHQTEGWVAGLFPHARRVIIQGAGHDLALTHPRELAEAIAEFLPT